MGWSASLKGAQVLVVEDEYLQALDIAQSLQEAGASVLGPVSTSEQAFQLISSQPCVAGILDFRLGAQDVTGLALELQRRNLPFVIHTGYDPACLPPALQGAWQVFSKPCSMTDLMSALAEMVRGHAKCPHN